MKSRVARIFSALILSVSSLLTLAMPLVHAAGPFTCTWTGAGTDTKFSTAANWSGCNSAAPQPADTDNLIFPANFTADNDLSGAIFNSLTFQGDGFLSGLSNAFTLGNGGITLVGSTSIDISTPITLALGSASMVVPVDDYLTLANAVSGLGGITKSGAGFLQLEGSNAYGGNTIANAGTIEADSATALGDTTGTTTINDTADLILGGCHQFPNLTIAENITLTGSSSDTTANTGSPKLSTCISVTGEAQYGDSTITGSAVTLSGQVTLGSDVTFGSSAPTTTFTGTLLGSHSINMSSGFPGTLVINSSSNGTSTPNGSYQANAIDATLADSQPSISIFVAGKSTVTLDGTRSSVYIGGGGTLKGSGTTGNLIVDVDGTVAPGHSPGCLNTSDSEILGTYQAEIGGTTACTGYDQLKVTGAVTLTDTSTPPDSGTLAVSLYGGFVPAVGQSYTIIDNDGSDPVVGTFNGLPEGATFTVTGVTYQISYKGGDGNDVTLTVTKIDASQLPKTPNTGLKLLMAHPLVSLATSTLAAGYLIYLSRRLNFAKTR